MFVILGTKGALGVASILISGVVKSNSEALVGGGASGSGFCSPLYNLFNDSKLAFFLGIATFRAVKKAINSSLVVGRCCAGFSTLEGGLRLGRIGLSSSLSEGETVSFAISSIRF